jgi:hypothetical protein
MLLGGSVDEFLMVGRNGALEDPLNDRPFKKEIHDKVARNTPHQSLASLRSDLNTP